MKYINDAKLGGTVNAGENKNISENKITLKTKDAQWNISTKGTIDLGTKMFFVCKLGAHLMEKAEEAMKYQ